MSLAATITLNGAPHPIEGTTTLVSLLESLGLADQPLVVELNAQAVFPRDFARTVVAAGATVEIVTLAAGG
jgi:thiamine biosynthesis protein ThiS